MRRRLRDRPPGDTDVGGIEIVSLTVTNNLRKILREKKIKYQECARRVRVSPSTMVRIMNGQVPAGDVMYAIAAVLDMPVQKVFIPDIKSRPVR